MKERFISWTSAWVYLTCALIEIVTFCYWCPVWDLDYTDYLTKRRG